MYTNTIQINSLNTVYIYIINDIIIKDTLYSILDCSYFIWSCIYLCILFFVSVKTEVAPKQLVDMISVHKKLF